MFYSELILARRGPLARVWLAAHMERKLSKSLTMQTDIEEATDAIMSDKQEDAMALRLSGQLLLGVVRIYSRKARYLLEDCNEALLRIKMAFRPGLVDLTDDQLRVNQNAITMQIRNSDLDMLVPDLNWEGAMSFNGSARMSTSASIAQQADITLRESHTPFDNDFEHLANYNDQFDFMPPMSPKQGKTDEWVDFDLGIDFGDSIEVGRNAPSELGGSMTGDFFGSSTGGLGSEYQSFGDNFDFGEAMDIDLGVGFEGPQPLVFQTPGQTRENSRESTPGPTTPQDELILTTPKPKRAARVKKQIIDDVTELSPMPGPKGRRRLDFAETINRDVSTTLVNHPNIPSTLQEIRFQEMMRDPVAFFMPTVGDGLISFAPKGVSKELHSLFVAPCRTGSIPSPLKRKNGKSVSPNKRPRLSTEEPNFDDLDDPETGRRGSTLPPSEDARLGSHPFSTGGDDVFSIDNFDDGPGFDMNMGFDAGSVGGFDAPPSIRRGPSMAPSDAAFTIPGSDVGSHIFAGDDYRIAMFDENLNSSPSKISEMDSKGYSKNTVKAIGLLKNELKSDGTGPKTASFQNMAENATRRAASSLFFELLVLGTRDCLKLEQVDPHDDIKIQAKSRLWETSRPPSSFASVSQRSIF